MVESDDGETLVPFDLDHIMAQIPELGKLHLQLESYSLPKPIDSSDMRPEHWCTLTEIIASNYADMDRTPWPIPPQRSVLRSLG